ncbi:hypothetical protein AAK967_06675 [Atopobiaceae bacterium 24-176]
MARPWAPASGHCSPLKAIGLTTPPSRRLWLPASASIKPNYDIEGKCGDPKVARAVEGAEDEVLEEGVAVGADESGDRYDEVSESAAGEE